MRVETSDCRLVCGGRRDTAQVEREIDRGSEREREL